MSERVSTTTTTTQMSGSTTNTKACNNIPVVDCDKNSLDRRPGLTWEYVHIICTRQSISSRFLMYHPAHAINQCRQSQPLTGLSDPLAHYRSIALKGTGIPLTTPLFRDRTNVKPSGRLLSPLIVQSGRRCLCLPVCADSRGPLLIFFLDAPVKDVVKPDQYESPGYKNKSRGDAVSVDEVE